MRPEQFLATGNARSVSSSRDVDVLARANEVIIIIIKHHRKKRKKIPTGVYYTVSKRNTENSVLIMRIIKIKRT